MQRGMGQHSSSPAGSQVHSSDGGSVIVSLSMVSKTYTQQHAALVTSQTPRVSFGPGLTSRDGEWISSGQGFVQSQ